VEDRCVNELIYLYGFVPASAPPPPADLAGVGGARVHVLALGDVGAVISRLPPGTLDAAAIEARMEDLAWVGQQGLAHEAVVLWFVDTSRIVPARLFSLHSSEAALRGAVQPDAARIAAQLAEIGDRREWNLKVAFDAAELARHGAEVSGEVRALDEEIAAAPPGRRYLLQRQRADLVKRALAGAARRLATELLEALAAHADDTRVLPVTGADEAGTVVLNAALLVQRHREPALQQDAGDRIEELRQLGMLPAFTGPWAPYRFIREGTHE
jgi:hypothetical protein